MICDGAMTLHGFARHARRRPGAGSPGPGAHPFDGVESTYRPLCWPIGLGESGVRNGGPGPAFLIITPALAFLTSGPPEVGRGWEVEPAELDGFRTADGRVRLVGRERHRTRWGTVTECEFEEESEPLDNLPVRDTAIIGVPAAVVMTDSAAA